MNPYYMRHQRLARKARVPVACGNEAEEASRSGIQEPKPGPDGLYDANEMAAYHKQMAAMHSSKGTMTNQLGKRVAGIASKEYWQQTNPLHRNFWANVGGASIGSAVGIGIGSAVAARTGNPHAIGVGSHVGSAVGTLTGAGLVSAADAKRNREAALKHAALAGKYEHLVSTGETRVKKVT